MNTETMGNLLANGRAHDQLVVEQIKIGRKKYIAHRVKIIILSEPF